jgi:predicted  nucleic acid-binding Zn-ribbon protein
MDYVDVYRQAIEGLNSQLEFAQEEFEIISEEKRLREEEETAQAAQKAKENEYGDMKIAVDEAKADIKNAEEDLATLNTRVEECQGNNNCDQELFAMQENAEAELAFANTAYEIANETFAYVNEELILRQEEANARALQKERTRVFNMVKSDVKLVSGIVESMD